MKQNESNYRFNGMLATTCPVAIFYVINLYPLNFRMNESISSRGGQRHGESEPRFSQNTRTTGERS